MFRIMRLRVALNLSLNACRERDVLTIMAVAPHEVSYIGSLSDEQPIVGVAEIPEVEGYADQGAEALVEEVGPLAAPQLEGVIAPDEVVINDIVLKPTSSVRDLRAAAKYLGVSQVKLAAKHVCLKGSVRAIFWH